MDPPDTPDAAAAAKAKADKAARKAAKNAPRPEHPPKLQPGHPGWCQTWFNFPLFGAAVGRSPYPDSARLAVLVGGGGASRSGVPNAIYVTAIEPPPPGVSDAPGAMFLRHPGHAVVNCGSELPFAVALSSRLGLVACSFGGFVRLFALAKDTIGLERVLQFQADFGDTPDLQAVQFCSPASSSSASASSSSAAAAGKEPQAGSDPVPQGDKIVTCGSDRVVRIYSIRTTPSPARIVCDAELHGTTKDINDMHACSFTDGGRPFVAVAAASDDGKLRLWSVEQPAQTEAGAGGAPPNTQPRAAYDVPDDGNTHPRAGGAIYKSVRFGKPSSSRANDAGALLFAVQSRMNRGKSYLVVWRRIPGSSPSELAYEIASRTVLFNSAKGGDKVVKMDVSRRADVHVVCLGSAGGRVCAVEVDPDSGQATVVGDEVRHSLVVSGLASVRMRGRVYILSTAMDKGSVLQPVAGLKAAAAAARRKRCRTRTGVLFLLTCLGLLLAWQLGYVHQGHVDRLGALFAGGEEAEVVAEAEEAAEAGAAEAEVVGAEAGSPAGAEAGGAEVAVEVEAGGGVAPAPPQRSLTDSDEAGEAVAEAAEGAAAADGDMPTPEPEGAEASPPETAEAAPQEAGEDAAQPDAGETAGGAAPQVEAEEASPAPAAGEAAPEEQQQQQQEL